MSSINPLANANWEGSAREYDRFEKKWHYYARVAERLLQRLEVRPGSRVLELASGTGACTLLLSRLCPDGRVVCVERSPTMVEIAKRNMKGEKRENVTFEVGDVANLRELVGAQRFDTAVCNSAFWQFREADVVAKAVYSALMPGGAFAFNLPSLFSFTTERLAFRKMVDEILEKHGVDRSKFWRVRERLDFRALLKRAGFEAIEDGYYYVTISSGQAEEWRRIPVFARRWGDFSTLPREVASEVLEAVRRRKVWDERDRQSRWRVVACRRPI